MYSYSDFFDLVTPDKMLTKQKLSESGKYPTFSSDSTNNGIVGYSNISPSFLCDEECPIFIIFGDHTRTFNIAKTSFNVTDNVKVLKPNKRYTLLELLFIISSWKKEINDLGYSRHWKIAKKAKILLPTKNGKIDFTFMGSFVAELEAQRVAELEAYLMVTGLKDYKLSDEEQKAIDNFDNIVWGEFNLEKLFGKSTRGRRLKSSDRVPGNLPFVTAGEVNTGISAFIGNDVNVFSKNTITIDMFGSAKYRNYSYGADDHITVVHTENLSKSSAQFITTSIHKSSHNGQFHYGRNFYAKNANELNINLPFSKNDNDIDFKLMDTLVSAIKKLVIKDVISYADKKLRATRDVIANKTN